VRENRTHGSEGGDGESRFRPLSDLERTARRIKAARREELTPEINFNLTKARLFCNYYAPGGIYDCHNRSNEGTRR
jgi:hypothetical protein